VGGRWGPHPQGRQELADAQAVIQRAEREIELKKQRSIKQIQPGD
jgi:hypothetical protein